MYGINWNQILRNIKLYNISKTNYWNRGDETNYSSYIGQRILIIYYVANIFFFFIILL
jgi:hypothetical protein